ERPGAVTPGCVVALDPDLRIRDKIPIPAGMGVIPAEGSDDVESLVVLDIEQRCGNLPACLPAAGGEDQGLAKCAWDGESDQTEEAHMKAAEAADEVLSQWMHLHWIPPLLAYSPRPACADYDTC